LEQAAVGTHVRRPVADVLGEVEAAAAVRPRPRARRDPAGSGGEPAAGGGTERGGQDHGGRDYLRKSGMSRSSSRRERTGSSSKTRGSSNARAGWPGSPSVPMKAGTGSGAGSIGVAGDKVGAASVAAGAARWAGEAGS